jgi:hypothetical protein
MTIAMRRSGQPTRKFAVVTTCNAAGYDDYGRRMVETFDLQWPEEVPLLLYRENFEPEVPSDRIIVRDLVSSCPDLMAFKRRHADNPLAHGQTERYRFRLSRNPYKNRIKLGDRHWGSGFRWDAVRFAHKAFAIFHAAANTDADVLIWVDADSLFFSDPSVDELESMIPRDCFVGYLDRPTYSECGFIAYNLNHPATQEMLAAFKRLYTHDELFRQYEFHDAYLFDVVRRQSERAGHKSFDIADGIGRQAKHVLINSRLGQFMDHIKGGRKSTGHSQRNDLVIERPEAYWRTSA